MGTNFYVKDHCGNNDPRYHIGKRSAAGFYCWDCHKTFCIGGEEGVHYSENKWYDKCPICGKSRDSESLTSSSVGRELGFNKDAPKPKTGVKSCCSFSWARDLGKIKHIVDEYGTEYSLEEFKDVLNECPIQYKHSVGMVFC